MQGRFTYPYIEVVGHPDNKVVPGEVVRLKAYYEAEAPEQPWYAPEWTVSVVAYKNGTILGSNDATHLTEGPVTEDPEFDVGPMPNNSITYRVVLYGNLKAWKTFPSDGADWVQLSTGYLTVEIGVGPSVFKDLKVTYKKG